MSRTCYLVRFDDICPTMNWVIWDRIESILIEKKIKPILAVVPNNCDKQLEVMAPQADFWERVRQWQERGWTIALHGYEHRYETRDSGLIGLNRRSEFAGLTREVQREKLSKAFNIFKMHGVKPDAWVAPGHSFDKVTVEILKEFGLSVVSDGYFWRPVRLMGCIWVPQQLWRFRPMKWGRTWTVCFHANEFSEMEIERFSREITTYSDSISSLKDVLSSNKIEKPSFYDKIFAISWGFAIKLRRLIR